MRGLLTTLAWITISTLIIPGCMKETEFVIVVLDETRLPTAVRLKVTDAEGTYYPPKGHEKDFKPGSVDIPVAVEKDVILDKGKRFAYIQNMTSMNLPHKKLRFELLKGFEYSIIDTIIDLKPQNDTLTFTLSKGTNLTKDWFSGDVHVHYINPETALLEMKAEDLNVCNILISDFTIDQDMFKGKAENISERDHIVYYNQEYREARLGHINFLNLKKKLIEPVKPERKYQYPLNTDASEEVRMQGGHISWAHFAAWPGLEAPLGAVLNKIDAVELLCTLDPFQSPIFVSDVVPDRNSNPGIKLWYRLLNCGLKIPLTAGTDKMNNQITVGANRVYAKIDGDFNYEKWIQSLNEGRTFITNSPLIQFSIENYIPGDSIIIQSEKTFLIKAEVWSQMPIDKLEIIANGNVIREVEIKDYKEPTQLQFEYPINKSTWLCARSYQLSKSDAEQAVDLYQRRDRGGGGTKLNEYFGTLRPEVSFAHTSPIYVVYKGQPTIVPQDAAYFAEYLQNSIDWLETEGKFPDDKAKQEVLNTFEKAKNEYLKLANHL